MAYVSLLTDWCQSDIVNDMITDPYTDPNINYEILENHVTRLKNKHLPLKTVKFNKHKHKGSKWISPADIAEKFNNFFIRMGSTLADKI